MHKNKLIKIILICFLISVGLEIFVFNFRTFSSINYKSINLKNAIYYHGIKVEGDKITINDLKNGYMEIRDIDKLAKNIKLDFYEISNKNYLKYKLYVTDEGNNNYYALPSRYLYPFISKSKYVKLNLTGKVKNIKITFLDENSDNIEKEKISFKIKGISINEKVPIDISLTRLILVFISLLILYIIRVKSDFYKYKIDFKNKYQIGIIFFTIVSISLVFLYIVNINPVAKQPPIHNNEYHVLTEALAARQVHLLIEPTETLKNMKNPYDFYERIKLSEKYGSFWQWDHCYYKGKYYVYFGVVPVILSYLPYYLITGVHLKNYVLAYIIMVITIISISLLLKEIVKKYFKNIPFLVYLILLVFSSFNYLLILQMPSIYTIPIGFSLMFSYLGLYFMFSSIKEKQLSCIRLFFGSLCMALVAGCRPQFLIGSLLLIPLFWKSIFVDRTLFSKKSIKQTVAFLLPYIFVAIFLMFYNYVRFGSVVDFGANYNITTNDMTKRGFNIDRIGYGLFMLLLQTPAIKSVYPFLSDTLLLNNYMGITIVERSYGGLLVTNLILWLGIFFFKFKKYLPKLLYYFSFISVISAMIILIFDIEMAGVLPRYILDFSWLLLLPTICVIMSLFNSKLDNNIKRVIMLFLLILIIGNLFYQFLNILDDKYFFDMLNTNTEYYFKWYYLMQWWL